MPEETGCDLDEKSNIIDALPKSPQAHPFAFYLYLIKSQKDLSDRLTLLKITFNPVKNSILTLCEKNIFLEENIIFLKEIFKIVIELNHFFFSEKNLDSFFKKSLEDVLPKNTEQRNSMLLSMDFLCFITNELYTKNAFSIPQILDLILKDEKNNINNIPIILIQYVMTAIKLYSDKNPDQVHNHFWPITQIFTELKMRQANFPIIKLYIDFLNQFDTDSIRNHCKTDCQYPVNYLLHTVTTVSKELKQSATTLAFPDFIMSYLQYLSMINSKKYQLVTLIHHYLLPAVIETQPLNVIYEYLKFFNSLKCQTNYYSTQDDFLSTTKILARRDVLEPTTIRAASSFYMLSKDLLTEKDYNFILEDTDFTQELNTFIEKNVVMACSEKNLGKAFFIHWILLTCLTENTESNFYKFYVMKTPGQLEKLNKAKKNSLDLLLSTYFPKTQSSSIYTQNYDEINNKVQELCLNTPQEETNHNFENASTNPNNLWKSLIYDSLYSVILRLSTSKIKLNGKLFSLLMETLRLISPQNPKGKNNYSQSQSSSDSDSTEDFPPPSPSSHLNCNFFASPQVNRPVSQQNSIPSDEELQQNIAETPSGSASFLLM